ncbi:MAG: hypothetical protein AB8G99_26460, partial [Planctomycetaceae bacterium]
MTAALFKNRIACLFCLVATLTLVPASVFAQDEEEEQSGIDGLPLLSSMKIPTAKELLDAVEPIDWIVLKDSAGENAVIMAEGVPERPNTLEVYRQQKKRRLDIFLPGGSSPEMNLPINAIDRIIYAQELMLKRVDLLIKTDDPDDIETAFELIMIVERQIPKWSPTGERLQAILFQDAQQKLKKGEQELGLALLEECH